MKLILPTTEELTQSGRLSRMQPEKPSKRHAPALVVNLSGGDIRSGLSNDLKHTIHASYVGRYADQILFGFHHLNALIGFDGEFNCQELDRYVGRLQRHVDNPPPARFAIPRVELADGGFTADFKELNENQIHSIKEPVFFGSPIEPANWGMWLLQGLPHAFAYVAAGQCGLFMCYAPEPWQQNLLTFLGVRPERVLQQAAWVTYRCDDVTLHQYSSIDLVVDQMTKAMLDAVASRCRADVTLPPASKLYVSRRSMTQRLGGNYRALKNEAQLIVALESRGYVVVEPETLTFAEQVVQFSRASAVVGLGGAGLFNTAFCPPRTKVMSLEGTDTFTLNHARFFASLDLEYGFVIGAEDVSFGNHPHNPWTLDIERALKAIDSFI